MNYYNENDPKTAAWLRELIKEEHISKGEVDERSIEDVTVRDLKGFNQHHFFAGIGGWSLALRLAEWPDNRSVWTGSCPCQPFSAAGKRIGVNDERHLWPSWYWLISQYRPNCIFGEQVASKDGIAWLDLVSTDLENKDYAVASVVLPACGVGAFHKRERLWFVANAASQSGRLPNKSRKEMFEIKRSNKTLAESEAIGLVGRRTGEKVRSSRKFERSCNARIMAYTKSNRRIERWSESNWRRIEWHRCKDKKYRPVKPGIFPLAHGISGRVGLLRGYGNAIVPQVAAQVISAYMEITA